MLQSETKGITLLEIKKKSSLERFVRILPQGAKEKSILFGYKARNGSDNPTLLQISFIFREFAKFGRACIFMTSGLEASGRQLNVAFQSPPNTRKVSQTDYARI
jgi:hypothetical protein